MRFRLVTIAIAALAAPILTAGTAAASPRWGAFKPDACVAVGKRQYSSRLWDIQGDWLRACKATGATIQRQRFAHPTRCKNRGASGMWGEFDVKDASCKVRWGAAKRDACTATGVRQYSARLWDIPGRDWTQACRRSEATVAGRSMLPARCKNLGAGGMWGEFDVADASCPFWGDAAGKPGVAAAECVAVNYRKYHARLWDVPGGVEWLDACRKEPQTVAGHATPRPSACVWKGPLGMWGEWVVKDTSCTEASLPQDARRRKIAAAKLAELGHVIASKVGFARQASTDRNLRASLDTGDASKIARAVNRSAAAAAPGYDGYPLRTLTVGLAIGAKVLVFGGDAEAGAAIDLKGKRPVYAYAAAGYNVGPGLAAGASVNVGFWVCQNNKIGGDGWGIYFGLDDLAKLMAKKAKLEKGASMAVGMWFDNNNVFQGFTLSPGVGAGLDFGGVVFSTTAVDGDETVQCDGRPK